MIKGLYFLLKVYLCHVWQSFLSFCIKFFALQKYIVQVIHLSDGQLSGFLCNKLVPSEIVK